MEKEPKKQILLDARKAILMDGLGYNVLVVEMMPSKAADGTEVIKVIFKPDETVRKRYNYRFEKELDSNGNVTMTIAKSDLVPVNLYDDSNRKWVYIKSFAHEETNLSMYSKNLRSEIQDKEKRILLLEAEVIKLYEQLELAKTNPIKFMKQGFELWSDTAKVVTELNKKEKEAS